MSKKFRILTAVLSILLLVSLAGCTGNDEKAPGEQSAEPDTKGQVELGYVEWDSEIASTHVVQAILEDKLGYETKITPVDAGVMFQGVAEGSFDGMVAAWLPGTHKAYMEEVGDKVEDLGANLTGAKIGLVVPEYVTINSIEELNGAKDKFEGRIVGIEPGAGIMQATEQAITDYGLDLELQDSSSAAMAASLEKAVNAEDWVVVTGWTPHWKFAKWELKYLNDPKGVYGGEEEIHTLVRQGLKDDMPEAYNFLDKFSWEPADMAAVMVKVQSGMEPADAAKEWVENNSDKVDAWLK